jgi:hypothetical protein
MARPPTGSPQKFFTFFGIVWFLRCSPCGERSPLVVRGFFFAYDDYVVIGRLGMYSEGGMEIMVERGVVMPPKLESRYPHGEMEVGDSFFVVGLGMQVVLNANWRASKKLGYKFSARKEGDGIRVWRVT